MAASKLQTLWNHPAGPKTSESTRFPTISSHSLYYSHHNFPIQVYICICLCFYTLSDSDSTNFLAMRSILIRLWIFDFSLNV